MRGLSAYLLARAAEGWRTDLTGEYSLTAKLTVAATSERVSFPGAADFNRASCRVTPGRELFARGGWVAGAKTGAIRGSTVTGAARTCNGGGWGRGRGLDVPASGRRYAFADIARIVQQDGCGRSRMEIGHGRDITERIFISQKLWLEADNPSVRPAKTDAQPGVRVRRREVSPGYREEMGGLYNERAGLIAAVAPG